MKSESDDQVLKDVPSFSAQDRESLFSIRSTGDHEPDQYEQYVMNERAVRWQTAVFKRSSLEVLSRDPDVTLIKLVELLDFPDPRDEVARKTALRFAMEIVENRKTVIKAMRYYEHGSEEVQPQARLHPGNVFRSWSKAFGFSDSHEPEGLVEMFTGFPLAIGLYLHNPADMAILAGKEILGFETRLNVPDLTTLEQLDVPIIVITSRGGLTAAIHEVAHTEQQVAVKKSNLTDLEHRVVWGSFHLKLADVNIIKSFFREHSEDSLDRIARSQIYIDAIEYAMSSAKDEILAHRKIGASELFEHLSIVRGIGGPYDYFRDVMGIPTKRTERTPEPSTVVYWDEFPLYARIWHDYNARIDECAKHTLEMLTNNLSAGFAGIEERMQTLRFVLMEIPMEQWDSKLQEMGVLEEHKAISEAALDILQIKEILFEVEGLSLYPDEVSIVNGSKALLQEFEDCLLSEGKGGGDLLTPMSTFKQRAENLRRAIDETELTDFLKKLAEVESIMEDTKAGDESYEYAYDLVELKLELYAELGYCPPSSRDSVVSNAREKLIRMKKPEI